VNTICAGFIETPMYDRWLDEVGRQRGIDSKLPNEQRNKMVLLGRLSTADECAGAIWFLLGQAINFTGGMITW
jgi:NAD(P)-dependent dehydrogenase (short-subunit alcohol dehydrogenase family)